MADEYRTKDLLMDELHVYKHLKALGLERVRFVSQSMGAGKNPWGNYKPLGVIGYSTNRTHEDRYIIFTSKHYTDSFGRKTAKYSSIRWASFSDVGLETHKYESVRDFKERFDSDL